MKVSRLKQLILGELLRLHKYNVIFISVFIALVWGIILYFVDSNIFDVLLPLLILVDSTMMSFMYIGSVMFFEKKESTLSSILVTPVKNEEIVLSKIFANTLHNLLSTSLVIIAFVFIKQVELRYILIFFSIIVITSLFTGLGLLFSYYQKDFTTMLMNIMILAFLLLIPSALFAFGIISGKFWEYILLINPIQAAQELINGGFKEYEITWKYYFSLAYLLVGLITTYKYLIIPKFQKYAVSISGV